MNTYCRSALHQIKYAIMTIIDMMETLDENDLQKRPSPSKHSIGELLEHMAVICEADSLISDGTSQYEMNQYYSRVSYKKTDEIKDALLKNYQSLEAKYMNYTDAELQNNITSYWGVTYSRYEWLLEIIAHIYHHRGQLNAILVHCYEMDQKVPLFE